MDVTEYMRSPDRPPLDDDGLSDEIGEGSGIEGSPVHPNCTLTRLKGGLSR